MAILLIARWLAGILSVAVLAAMGYLLWTWDQGYVVRDLHGIYHHYRGSDWRLYAALALAAWSLLGRFALAWLFPKGTDEPRSHRAAGRAIAAPDGSKVWVETQGPDRAPTIVFTHGWGMNATTWWYAIQRLSKSFHLVLWDLPGLGLSSGPSDGRYSLERMAQALETVLSAAGGRPVVVVGHSIGGMIIQTLCRDAPDLVAKRIAGIVLVNTTYTDPSKTMIAAPLWQALKWPLIRPLLWLQIGLGPLVRLMNWKSYLDGSALLAMRLTGFGRHATRGQLELVTHLAARNSPGVQAKGDLAMLAWDATGALSKLTTPVLILGGGADIVTLPRASLEMARAAPTGTPKMFAGVGHMGLLEQGDDYAVAIGAFADDSLTAARRGPDHAVGVQD